jgi:hypothetical protein
MSFTSFATHPFPGRFLACAAIVACAPAPHPTAPIPVGPPPAVTAAAAAVNRFGFELYDAMRDRPGNLVVAPLGAAAALAQVALATGGDTRAAIARVLHSSPDDEALGAYATLVDAVNAQDATGGFLFRVLPQVSTDGAGTRLTSAMRLRMKTWASSPSPRSTACGSSRCPHGSARRRTRWRSGNATSQGTRFFLFSPTIRQTSER